MYKDAKAQISSTHEHFLETEKNQHFLSQCARFASNFGWLGKKAYTLERHINMYGDSHTVMYFDRYFDAHDPVCDGYEHFL